MIQLLCIHLVANEAWSHAIEALGPVIQRLVLRSASEPASVLDNRGSLVADNRQAQVSD